MVTEITIPGDLAGARRVQELIEEALSAAAFPAHAIFAIKLNVEEALVHAIKDGNQMDPDKHLHVICTITAERFEVRITDEGSGSTRVVSHPAA